MQESAYMFLISKIPHLFH